MSDTSPPDLATLSFEDALEQLAGIVRQLEAGQVPLDSAISLYERATALKAHCDARLRDAIRRQARHVPTREVHAPAGAPRPRSRAASRTF